MPKLIDLTGRTFGRLTAIRLMSKKTGPNDYTTWLCRCACGTEKVVIQGNLGRTTVSCGCHRREASARRLITHGQRRSPLYKTWSDMKARCRPDSKARLWYFDRGIRVDPRWETFENFAKDMSALGPRPKGMSLDRVNNAGNYEPGNVRWATAREQALNSRRRPNQRQDLATGRFISDRAMCR